jgi:phosphatidylglycerol:prolipoprotein diacylglycerol transferase
MTSALYSLCLGSAGAVLLWSTVTTAGRAGLPARRVSGILLAAFAAGIAGARLLYVAEHRELRWDMLLSPAIGGFASYGGIVAGCLAAAGGARWSGISVARLFDAAVPGLCLFGAIARLGCFLAGCCFGSPTTLPWAVNSARTHLDVHPVQLYESVFLLILVTVLARFTSPMAGVRFLWLLLLYPSGRILLELFRGDANRLLPVLTVPQAWSLMLCSLAVISLSFVYLPSRRLASQNPNP